MLYNLQPDRSVTGGAWYSDQDFESEFVEVLNQQCFKFLQSKVQINYFTLKVLQFLHASACEQLVLCSGGGGEGRQAESDGPEEQLLRHVPRSLEVHL